MKNENLPELPENELFQKKIRRNINAPIANISDLILLIGSSVMIGMIMGLLAGVALSKVFFGPQP